MPELPDVVVYAEHLARRLVGHRLLAVRLASPFVLRTARPPLASIEAHRVLAVRRSGKRLVLAFDGDLFLVIHLMIAGRLHWHPDVTDEADADPNGAGSGPGRSGAARASSRPTRQRASPASRRSPSSGAAKFPPRALLAVFRFEGGELSFTEAGTRKRASIHLLEGEAALAAHDRGGLEVLQADLPAFVSRLRAGNHTLKRMLTSPQVFSGIGNAYSDEILHRARLSPILLTSRLDDDQVERLYTATRAVLAEWIDRLRREAGDNFPEKVTAFRPEMAVHGRFGQPCPVCGSPVQRIVHADNETNYCARCQTGGVVLADRALSRLLKSSWRRSLEDD